MMKHLFALFFFLSSCFITTSASSTPIEIQAVVFDFDGVIATVDQVDSILFFTKLLQTDISELRPTLAAWHTARSRGEDEKDFWERYAASVGKKLPKSWFQDYLQTITYTEVPGVIDIVKNLQKQEYKTPLVSNIHYEQANIIRKLGLYSLFDPVLLSCDIGVSKPNKEVFQILLSKIHLPAAAVLFIDNTQENVEAAALLGINTIHFTSAQQLKEELQKRNIVIEL